MTDDDERGETRRQAARRERRTAGDRSARIASTLMKLPESSLGKLELDDDLREAIETARKVTSQVARRRAERTLAGALRRVDLADVQRQLSSLEATGMADTQLFHLAEQWRARLISEGIAAAESFPGGAAEPLPALVDNARRERDTGKPPGASRALFRHVMTALRSARSTATDPSADADADDAVDAVDVSDDESPETGA